MDPKRGRPGILVVERAFGDLPQVRPGQVSRDFVNAETEWLGESNLLTPFNLSDGAMERALNDDHGGRPDPVVDVPGRGEQGVIEFDHVGWLLASGVFYRLSSDPSALIQKDRAVVNIRT